MNRDTFIQDEIRNIARAKKTNKKQSDLLGYGNYADQLTQCLSYTAKIQRCRYFKKFGNSTSDKYLEKDE